AYKEYYAVATGATPPKPKASVRKTRSNSDTTITPPTAAAGPRLTTSEKDKQATKASKAKCLSALSEVAMTEAQQLKLVTKRSLQQTHISQASGSGNCEENVVREEGHDEEEKEDILYRDQSSSVSSQFVTSMLNLIPDAGMESIFKMTTQMDVQTSTSVAPLPMSAPTLTFSTIATITTTQQAPLPPTTALSTLLQDLPNFGSLFGFDKRLKTLEANFSEFMQTNQFAGAIINEQIKEQVSKILPKIEQTMNEQLEAEVLTRSSNSSKTSYAIAADVSKMELKNILIKKMKGNKVDTLTPELLAGPTYELMKGSCKSLVELEYQLEEVYKATTDQLDWVNPEGQQYPHNLLKPLPLISNNRGRRVIPFDHFINNDLEYLRRGDFKRLRIQDIEDMLLLLVQGKLTNLTVEERFAFNVSLRMFTRSIVIQRHTENLQLGVESYQKKLNLTKPDTYRFDLKCKEAYIAYSNPRGFIYHNKDKQNRLMRIDELHKFSDGTLIDIRMKYLPHLIWRKSDKDRAAAMIQAIDKRLKTRRIMRSLERFVRRRLYEGDFRMLQWTT
nr:hypothetical protein [Tanacetum cinerariifolium]